MCFSYRNWPHVHVLTILIVLMQCKAYSRDRGLLTTVITYVITLHVREAPVRSILVKHSENLVNLVG
jgi:hypothetical protein